MLLKAKKNFCVDLVDGDGFVIEEDGFCVEKDSLWMIDFEDEEDYLNGCEVYIYECNTSRYLTNVSIDDFGTLFEEQ